MVARRKTAAVPPKPETELASAKQHWALLFSKQAQKDAHKLSAAGLKSKAMLLLDIIKSNPYQIPPPYEKLVGDLNGAYSRRINIQHRLVYQVLEDSREVRVLRLWTHYD